MEKAMTHIGRDELIRVALETGAIKVDQEKGYVFILRGPKGVKIIPRICGTDCNGYLVARISIGKEEKQVRLHRVVWISKYGIPSKGMVVCHKNNNKKDNRIRNLYLATPMQNTSDAARDGLLDGRNTKIDFEIAQSIRADYATKKHTIRGLAEIYNLSKSRIGQIVQKQCWT